MKYKDLIHKEIPAEDSTSEGEKRLLYALVRELKPDVIVETGTHRGMTTLYLADAVLHNGNGHIYTCDPFPWGQLGNFRKFPELDKLITFRQIKGSDMKVDNIDFLFIDGFHSKQDVLDEVGALFPSLSERAVVVFHDCWYGDKDGVNEAIEELGLETTWLPTKNALRIYSKHEQKPTS